MMNEWLLIGGCCILLALALGMALYPLRKSLSLSMILLPAIICLVSYAYWHWGAWPDWKQYLQDHAKQEQIKEVLKSVSNPKVIIDRLHAHLKKNPQSARGWYLLGRLYASQNQWQEAYDMYEKAYQLKSDDEQITINYAQSIWQLNHQKFNEKVRGLFQSVLQKDNNQPDALAMLAMDAYQAHQYQQAIDYWQRLLKIARAQSPDEQAIRKAIIKAQQRMM